MTGDEDTPLARWSRRKQIAQQAKAAPPPLRAEAEPAPADGADAPPPEESEAETLARLGLPDPDTLKQGDDFSVFMARAVPELIRRRALRRLWLSNPVLANLDGLNDYDGDFTESGVAGGVLKTAYRAGKGYLRDLAETGTGGEATPEPEPADTLQPAAAALPAEATLPEVTVIADADTPGRGDEAAAAGDPMPRPRPRRMRFDCSGQD